jgi:hypothetical protein
MKTRIILLLLLGFLFILNSCKKPEELPTYYIPQEFKDYAVFPVGSYWVYKDSVSGVLDTVTLQEQTFSIVEQREFGYNYESLVQVYYYSMEDDLYRAYNRFNDISFANWELYDIYNFHFICADIGYISGFGNASVESFFDTLIVNSVPYSNVFCIKWPYYTAPKNYSYWSKNIGLIKKVDTTNVWELVDYNVN